MADDIYNEISEDLRQQELEKFWKENREWIIGGVIAAIVFTGALSWWRGYEYDKNVRATAAMTAAIESADPAKIDAFAQEADKNHALLAKLAEARLYLGRKENAKAAAVYDDIAGMSRIGGTWRDLARLYSIEARLDTDKPEKLHEDLAALTRKSDWRYTALELEALLYARERKNDKAHEIFAKLADDPDAPRGIRIRATTLRDFYAGGGNGNG